MMTPAGERAYVSFLWLETAMAWVSMGVWMHRGNVIGTAVCAVIACLFTFVAIVFTLGDD